MKVGLGLLGSCSVLSVIRPPRRRLATSCIELSRVCITSTITVRCDQSRLNSSSQTHFGWRTIWPSHFSGRVTLVPSPVSTVNSPRSAPPPAP